MNKATTRDVQALYQRYPFPHGTTTSEADFLYASSWLLHFHPWALAGRTVLEAGCGTGNKLVALAKMYPHTQFTGIDLSEPSLAVARKLVAHYQAANVELRQGDLMQLDETNRYDVIQSVGVVHHLEDPESGLRNLCAALKPEGMMLIWLYHPLGEFDRLAKRELLLTLWGEDRSDLTEGQRLMELLGLDLESGHYGPREKASDDLEGKADAFMHPIVNAYRFADAFALFRRAGCTWAAVDFINLNWALKFVNLEGVDDPKVAKAAVGAADVLAAPELRQRCARLPKTERLRVIELALRPRGYLLMAGKSDIDDRLTPRIRGNRIVLV